MAVIEAAARIDSDWVRSDVLRLRLGAENATPGDTSGADVVAAEPIGRAAGTKALQRRYTPTDRTALMPVGLDIADAAGNVSTLAETWVMLNDAPAPPDPASYGVAATANPNEALFTFPASAGVE